MYRQFLRYGARAVSHRFPQKFVVQKVLRKRFASGDKVDHDRLVNTLQFFRAAAESNGLERRCIQTLTHYYASQHKQLRVPKKNQAILEYNEQFMRNIIEGLNETQRMCL